MPPSPAHGPTSSRGQLINACIWFMLVLAGIFLGLRLYCKALRRRGLWWDDYFLAASWILLLVCATCITINSTLGFGRHAAQVPPENWATLDILSLCSGTFSILSSVTSKTSFALTLLRLSDGWMKILIWTIIAAINLLMPFSVPLLWITCSPSGKLWKPYHGESCWDPQISILYAIIVGAFSAACDFGLALLPWKILMRFHMYRREKIGVGIAMSMGIFAGATVVIKCFKLPLLGSPDFTYEGASFVIWGFAECAVTIMAASIPVLRALFNEIRTQPPVPRLPSLAPVVSSADRANSKDGDATVYTVTHRNDDRSDKSLLERCAAGRSGQLPDDADVPELPSGSRAGEAAGSDAVELRAIEGSVYSN